MRTRLWLFVFEFICLPFKFCSKTCLRASRSSVRATIQPLYAVAEWDRPGRCQLPVIAPGLLHAGATIADSIPIGHVRPLSTSAWHETNESVEGHGRQ
jgi:hypothetical protein